MRLDFWGLIRRDQAEPPTLGGGSAPFSDGGSVASDVPQNSFIATPTTTTSTVASPSAPVILFEDTFFSGQDDRIFNAVASTGSEPSVGGSSKTLSWLIEDKSADITDVSWLGRRENDGEFERIVTADNDDDKFDADSPFDSGMSSLPAWPRRHQPHNEELTFPPQSRSTRPRSTSPPSPTTNSLYT